MYGLHPPEENWKDSRSISIQKLLPRRGGTCAGDKEELARGLWEGSLKQPAQEQQRDSQRRGYTE